MRSKRVVAVLGLCAALLALVVFGTSASQAEKGANWMVNGKSVTAELLPEVVIAEVVSKDMTLLFTTKGGTKVELLCEGATFIGAKLETEGKVGGGNKVKFGGCTMKLNGVVSKACEPHTGAEKGVLVSTALKGLIVLTASKEPVVLFEPVSGTTFLDVELSEECTIGELCAITGKNSIKDVNGEWAVEKVSHVVEQGSISALSVLGVPASVDGQGVLKLGGSHAGIKWSGVPA